MTDSLPEFYCPYSDECYECCLDTEMTLSNSDVKRIEMEGYIRSEFLKEEDGFLVLQNLKGQCYFLKDRRCSIYKFRPQGCRFYPLIYDFEREELLVDELCTNHTKFDIEDYESISEEVIIFVNAIITEKEIRLGKRKKKNRKV
jgi:Fe-S-cluster containining protein